MRRGQLEALAAGLHLQVRLSQDPQAEKAARRLITEIESLPPALRDQIEGRWYLSIAYMELGGLLWNAFDPTGDYRPTRVTGQAVPFSKTSFTTWPICKNSSKSSGFVMNRSTSNSNALVCSRSSVDEVMMKTGTRWRSSLWRIA